MNLINSENFTEENSINSSNINFQINKEMNEKRSTNYSTTIKNIQKTCWNSANQFVLVVKI